MANPAIAPLEKQSKDRSALVNAKMTNFLMIRETASLVAATKSFLMELVPVQLDSHAIHVEFAHFHVEQVNSSSKEPVQYALLTLSLTQLSMAAAALKASTWIPMEFAKNYK